MTFIRFKRDRCSNTAELYQEKETQGQSQRGTCLVGKLGWGYIRVCPRHAILSVQYVQQKCRRSAPIFPIGGHRSFRHGSGTEHPRYYTVLRLIPLIKHSSNCLRVSVYGTIKIVHAHDRANSARENALDRLSTCHSAWFGRPRSHITGVLLFETYK